MFVFVFVVHIYRITDRGKLGTNRTVANEENILQLVGINPTISRRRWSK